MTTPAAIIGEVGGIASALVASVGDFMGLYLHFPLTLFLGMGVIGFGVKVLGRFKNNR